MLTGHETGLKKSAYKDIQAPLELLMTQPQAVPSEGISKGMDVQAEYSVKSMTAGTETLLEEKPHPGALKDLYGGALKNLSVNYLNHYKIEKQWDSPKSTHQIITEQALSLIDKTKYSGEEDELISESSGPDHEAETIKFVMEGHFCGRMSDGSLGNFLQEYMPSFIFNLLDGIEELKDHLKETALSNIGRYSAKYVDEKAGIKYLAWTLHFLQDITAPHHAGNIPAFVPTFITDINGGRDTHSDFEEFANKFMKKQPDQFNVKAKSILTGLRTFPGDIRNPQKLQDFGKMILEKSLDIIKSPLRKGKNILQTKSQKAWEEVIAEAMPLAIAATAAVLEKMR